MSDDRCKVPGDCQTPSACRHYAECLRTTIPRRPDARCKDCPGPAFGLCCRPAGDAAPRPARPIAHVHSNGEVCLERLPSSQVWPVSLYEYPAAHLPADEVLEKVERALRAVLAGSSRSSDGLMGWWNTPTIATMEQCDEALAALRSLRGNKT